MQGPHPAFQLGDEVLLVATGTGLGHHFISGELPVVGDVKKEAVLLEQDVVAPLDRQVLPQGDHPVVLLAFSGPVGELDHFLVLGADRLIPALADDAVFDVRRAGPRLGGDLPFGFGGQLMIDLVRAGFGPLDQIGFGVVSL